MGKLPKELSKYFSPERAAEIEEMAGNTMKLVKFVFELGQKDMLYKGKDDGQQMFEIHPRPWKAIYSKVYGEWFIWGAKEKDPVHTYPPDGAVFFYGMNKSLCQKIVKVVNGNLYGSIGE